MDKKIEVIKSKDLTGESVYYNSDENFFENMYDTFSAKELLTELEDYKNDNFFIDYESLAECVDVFYKNI